MQIFLISGLSGSGKSVALKALEDSGFYCVDNLPAELLVGLVDYLLPAGYRNLAISIDARSANGVQKLPAQITELRNKQLAVHVFFLDSRNDVLVQRFSETRRLHPLNNLAYHGNAQFDASHATLSECVAYERELLEDISQIGHHIDTSELNANALRAWIKQFVELDRARITLLFQSFGFKYGIPMDADFVFDVRCLPNPHYNLKLRPQTGRDADVIAFLDENIDVQAMYNDIRSFVGHWLPNFIADNRSYLTIAIGCTGGQHRSVYLSEKLAAYFSPQQQVLVRHRQITPP